MHRRWNLVLAIAGLALGLTVLSIGCAAEKATPTATPTKAPVATATPTATAIPTATPRPGVTPTQVVATPTATNTPAPTAAPKLVVLKAANQFWSKNDPIDDHYSTHIHDLNFDVLNKINETGELLPQVATKWEQRDTLRWRFYLRNDVKFHDGSPLTADDVKFSIDETLNRPGSNIRTWTNFSKVEKVDNYTIDIVLKKVDVTTPRQFSAGFIVSKQQIDKEGWAGFAKKPLGSGPWRWTEWVPWDHTVAEKVPGDHPFRKVGIDRIEIYQVTQTETAIAGMRTGALELAVSAFFPEQVQDLESRGFKSKVLTTSQAGIHLTPPDACRLKYPTCDVRVRRALAMSIDRELVAKTLYLGYATPLRMAGLPTNTNYLANEPLLYNPKEAERLLDEAGYPRDPKTGIRMELEYMNWIPGLPDLMALAFSDMWQKIGVKMNYRKVDISEALKVWYRTGGTQVPPLFQIMTMGDGYGENFNFTRSLFCDDLTAKLCTFPYTNSKFLELQEKVYNEPDEAKRGELIKQVHKLMIEDVPVIWTVTRPDFYVYSARWTGVTGRGTYTIWDDTRATK